MLAVVSARLPSGEAPVSGVPLVPYVLVRRGDSNALAGDDVPEEGTPAAADVRFSLRFRWYRSVLHRGSALCWIHPDREATIQVRASCVRGATIPMPPPTSPGWAGGWAGERERWMSGRREEGAISFWQTRAFYH